MNIITRFTQFYEYWKSNMQFSQTETPKSFLLKAGSHTALWLILIVSIVGGLYLGGIGLPLFAVILFTSIGVVVGLLLTEPSDKPIDFIGMTMLINVLGHLISGIVANVTDNATFLSNGITIFLFLVSLIIFIYYVRIEEGYYR